MRKWIFLVMLLAAGFASAANATVWFPGGDNLWLQPGNETSVVITVTNEGAADQEFFMNVNSNQSMVFIDGSGIVKNASLGTISAGANGSKTVVVGVLGNSTYDATAALWATVYDENNTEVNRSEMYVKSPAWESVNITYEYRPASNSDLTLIVYAKLERYLLSSELNITNYTFTDDNDVVCASGNISVYKGAVGLENCSGMVDIWVNVTSLGLSKTGVFNNFYVVKEINISYNVSFLEDPNFWRPYEEAGYVGPNATIRIEGYGLYDNGDGVGNGKDDTAFDNITLSLASSFNDSKHVSHADGHFIFQFTGPNNYSDKAYDYKLEMNGIWSLEEEVTVPIFVNKTFYRPETEYRPSDEQAINNKILLTESARTNYNNGSFTVRMLVNNTNLFGLAGKVTFSETNFLVSMSDTATVPGEGGSNFSFDVIPMKFTRPGTYTFKPFFTSTYGDAFGSVDITIPERTVTDGVINVFRYVNYTDNASVTLHIINKKSVAANVTVEEKLGDSISDSLENCSSVLLGYVPPADGVIPHCPIIVYERPKYFNGDNDIFVWVMTLQPGESKEVTYVVNKSVEDGFFSEPTSSFVLIKEEEEDKEVDDEEDPTDEWGEDITVVDDEGVVVVDDEEVKVGFIEGLLNRPEDSPLFMLIFAFIGIGILEIFVAVVAWVMLSDRLEEAAAEFGVKLPKPKKPAPKKEKPTPKKVAPKKDKPAPKKEKKPAPKKKGGFFKKKGKPDFMKKKMGTGKKEGEGDTWMDIGRRKGGV